VAANLQRLPSVTPGEVKAPVAALTAKLDALTNRMESMNCCNLVNLTKRLDSFEAKTDPGHYVDGGCRCEGCCVM